MVEPFFTADNRFPTISMALEDILPEETTSALVKGRAVYLYYVNALAARPSDEDVRPFRRKALMGHLTPPDFADMHTLLTAMKSQAPHAVTRQQQHHTWAAYAQLNSSAMLLAHILFVDTSMKEGWPGRIEEAARERVLDGLSASLRARSATNGAASPRRTHALMPRCSCYKRPSTRCVCPMKTS